MSDGVKIYGRDEALNARETMTTEQILAAIQRAITTGEVTDEFTAFIEMIKEQNKGIGVKMWLGTQDEFNALEKTESNIIYFVYTTVIKDISDGIQELYDGLMDGTIKVYAATNADEATHATNADEATHATSADNVSSTINGKAISSIFESDGYTVSNANNARIRTGKTLWKGNWSGARTHDVPLLSLGSEYCFVLKSEEGFYKYATGCSENNPSLNTVDINLFTPNALGFSIVRFSQYTTGENAGESYASGVIVFFSGGSVRVESTMPGNIVEIIHLGDYASPATAS